MSEEIQRKNQTVSPRSGAVANPRGGARPGSGRKPDAYKQLLNAALSSGVTQDDLTAIVKSLVSEAKTGNVQAANALFDRMFGKVPQAVQHQGDTGGALRIVVEYEQK